MQPHQRRAVSVYLGVDGCDADSPRNSMAVKSAYMEKYKKNLEDSFISECGGRFKRLLVSLAQCERHDGPVDQEKVVIFP